MVDLTAIKQAARVVKDENGNEVVQIPLQLCGPSSHRKNRLRLC